MTILYTAHATAIAGRDGQAETSDKSLSVKLSPPGSNKPGTNPEQLFACGYGACFGSAVAHVAKMQNVAVGEIKVQADVNLDKDEATGFSISVTLNVTIAGVDAKVAEDLVFEAHHVCPYSKATSGNIKVELKANGEAVKAEAA